MRIFFAWYDFWIGVYWDRQNGILYICPLPMIVLEIRVWELHGKWKYRELNKAVAITQKRAEADGYERIDDWLTDMVFEMLVELQKRGVENVTSAEIYVLLLEENGDREKVMQGYLEN